MMQIYEKNYTGKVAKTTTNGSIYLRFEHYIENIFIFHIQLNFEFRRDQINFFFGVSR